MWGPVSVGARRGTRLSSLVMATDEVAERQVAAAASATLRLQRYGPRHRSSNKAATLRRRSSQLGAPRELVRTHRAMRSHHRPRASSATSSVPLGSVYPISATVKGPLCHGGPPPPSRRPRSGMPEQVQMVLVEPSPMYSPCQFFRRSSNHSDQCTTINVYKLLQIAYSTLN